MDGVLPGPAEAIAVLLEEGVTIGELLDLIDEINSIVDNAENAIDAMRSKTLILSMTFTNR